MVLFVVHPVIRAVQNNTQCAVEIPTVVVLWTSLCVVSLERRKLIAVVVLHLFALVVISVAHWIQMSNQCWGELTQPTKRK